jgi:hypothetical protein
MTRLSSVATARASAFTRLGDQPHVTAWDGKRLPEVMPPDCRFAREATTAPRQSLLVISSRRLPKVV